MITLAFLLPLPLSFISLLMLCREAGNKENVFAWDDTARQAQIERAEHVQCFQMFKLFSIPSLAKWFSSLFLQILQHPGDVGFF